MVTKTSAEAQNQFGQLLDLVQREPVAITRHGRPAAFVISPREMEDIQEEREKWRKRIAADWDAWREKARKSMTRAAVELTDEEINRMVHELR
jgi:prevent-host-death family protein